MRLLLTKQLSKSLAALADARVAGLRRRPAIEAHSLRQYITACGRWNNMLPSVHLTLHVPTSVCVNGHVFLQDATFRGNNRLLN
jgi:hypothetical protein